MKKNQKIVVYLVSIILVMAVAALIFFIAGKSASQESKMILFYGQDCPHCEKVEKFIKDNQVDQKIFFIQKEVYLNKDNAAELVRLAGQCGLATDSVGVPFFWDGSRCISGDEDVINFFKEKIN